jgi:anti-sigma regulatory factor (Ser/Thr protein kinase)
MNIDTLVIAAKVENLPLLNEFLERKALEAGMSATRRHRLMLALEEAFVNVCQYAYPGGEGDVWLNCTVECGAFVIELVDFGELFDLLSLPDPDLEVNLEQRKIGGLGVYCIRNLVDEVKTRREGNRNILRMVFYLN